MKLEGAKGHLDLLLLGVLRHGPRHGYAVITALRDHTGGALDLAEGSVYPALHRLEDQGLLASDWEPIQGRRRRTYRITAKGQDALLAENRDWRSLVSAVEAVLGSRPAVRTS
ncbi:MAG: helix-turn-helix transcriptional regulator [Actinomycetota bacterium]|nr:helix-turn-helix transcriptional regulator [Actinomycetota bacterium]